MSNAARAYLREVKSLIPCPGSLKAPFLRQLADEVILFCEDNNCTDPQQINDRFGTPDMVAKEFLEELDPGKLRTSVQNQKRLILLVVVAALLFTAAFGIREIRGHLREQAYREGNYIEFVPYEGELPEASGPAYWVRTNDGKDVQYWEYDYELNEWVNVSLPTE